MTPKTYPFDEPNAFNPGYEMKKWILNQYWLWIPFHSERSRNTCGIGIDFERYKAPAFKNILYRGCQVIGDMDWQDKEYLVSQWLRETKNKIE